jgi:hypothetical protein
MNIKIIDDEDYEIEIIDTSVYDLTSERDISIIKDMICEAIQCYIEDNID